MRHSLLLSPRDGSTPEQPFCRVARSIPLPHRLATASAESANAASLTDEATADTPGANPQGTDPASHIGDAAASHARARTLGSQALQAAARQHRARRIGALAAALLRSAAARLRDWRERYRRGVEAQAIYRSLAELDARTLSDLGIHHRGELRSIAQRLAHGEDVHGICRQR